MEIYLNLVPVGVVKHFKEEYKYELDCMYCPDCIVLEDDADSNEYIMTVLEDEYTFRYGVIMKHNTYQGQDYIILLINND